MSNLKQQRLLVIAPHPDDEVLGCAGLIQKVKEAGGKVFVLFLTVGDTRDFSKEGFSSQVDRQEEIEQVAQFLRFDDFEVAFPGNDYHLLLDRLGQKPLMDVIERNSRLSLERVKPTMVAFPSLSSYNQDHRIAALATHAALRPANGPKHFVPTVLMYEEVADGWTLTKESEPNCYVTLSPQEVDAKQAALALYRTQVRPAPHMRSVESVRALAQLRGAQSGTLFAEAFTLLRTVIQSRSHQTPSRRLPTRSFLSTRPPLP